MKKDLRLLSLLAAASIVAGSVFYHAFEKWSWLDSIYFSVITLTTVGYGDFVPTTPESKIFTMIYVLVGIGIIFGLIRTATRDGIDKATRKGIQLERKKVEIKEELEKKKKIIKKIKG